MYCAGLLNFVKRVELMLSVLRTVELYIYICLVTQLCPTLCNPMDYSLPGSSIHGYSPSKNIEVGCHSLLQDIYILCIYIYAYIYVYDMCVYIYIYINYCQFTIYVYIYICIYIYMSEHIYVHIYTYIN